MSRSGYNDDNEDQWQFIRWRGAVTSAIRGKRGQVFLKEMLVALDALPEKKLITGTLQDDYEDGAVCALGAVGRRRGVAMDKIVVDEDDDGVNEEIAGLLEIPHALACEVMWMNDEAWSHLTPEARFNRMRRWIARQIDEDLYGVDRWADDGGRAASTD